MYVGVWLLCLVKSSRSRCAYWKFQHFATLSFIHTDYLLVHKQRLSETTALRYGVDIVVSRWLSTSYACPHSKIRPGQEVCLQAAA